MNATTPYLTECPVELGDYEDVIEARGGIFYAIRWYYESTVEGGCYVSDVSEAWLADRAEWDACYPGVEPTQHRIDEIACADSGRLDRRDFA